jgi:hypothetical protein
LEQNVFQALLKIAGSIKGFARQQFVLELERDGIAIGKNVFALGFFFGALFFEMAPVFAVPCLCGQDAMRSLGLKGPVFQPVDAQIKGAGSGDFVRLESGDEGQPGFCAKIVDERIDAGLLEQLHEVLLNRFLGHRVEFRIIVQLR